MGRVIVFVILVAAVIYFLFWTFERRRAAGGGRPGPRISGPRRPQPGPPRTLAPDDDPEFLWRLEQERKRRERDGDGDTS